MPRTEQQIVAALLGGPLPRRGLPRHMLVRDREETCRELFEWVAGGGSLTSFCAAPANPNATTVQKWLKEDQELQARFDEALEVGCDMLANQCLDIADDRNPRDKEDVKHRGLRIKTRMDLIEKWSKRYSKKLRLADADGEKLTPARSEEEIMNEIKGLLGVGLSRMVAENRLPSN